MASWWFTFGFCCWWEKSLSYDWFTVKGSGHPILVQDFFCQQLQLKLCSHDILSSSVTHCYHVPEFYSHCKPSMGEGDVTWNHCRSSIIERQTWMHQSVSKKSGFPSKIPRKENPQWNIPQDRAIFPGFSAHPWPVGGCHTHQNLHSKSVIFKSNSRLSLKTNELYSTPPRADERKIMAKLKLNSLGQIVKSQCFFSV